MSKYEELIDDLDELIRDVCYDYDQDCERCPVCELIGDKKECLISRVQNILEEL